MATITIQKDAEGKPTGVRVQTLGEDFLIALHDNFGGEEVTFSKAESILLPDSPMVMALYWCLGDVNEKLKEAGGQPLRGWYWSKTYANIVFGDNVPGRLVFEANRITLNLNYNYEFFLCDAKVREFTDLRKEDEE